MNRDHHNDHQNGHQYQADASVQSGRPEEILIYPDGRTVLVKSGVDPGEPERWWQRRSVHWAIGLFVITCLSTFQVGETRYSDGFGYMIPVMLILLAHEMGHYVTSRIYRASASPPFFIPAPFTPLGTFGAVIVKGAGSREDRKALFDIAIAGPLAGLLVAIPVCIYGAMHAKIIPIDEVPPQEFHFIAPPILRWIVTLVVGDWPAGHVMESAVLDAGWVGIFITALNLIPIGQLDGGHMLYCLIGKWAHRVAHALVLFALLYMLLTSNYTFMIMLLLILMMGPYHPPTANDHVPLGTTRIVLGWLTLSFIFVGFTPTPIVITGM